MKRFSKTMLGVTLLEIMLVLAVAAMIIVMSVRYYQSANISQQANATLQQVQAITAAADSLSQGSGTYSGVTSTAVKTIVPASGFNSPWGGTITVSGAAAGLTITFNPAIPTGVCNIVTKNLTPPNFTMSGCTSVTHTK